MNTTQKLGLLLLALSFSGAALAKGGVKPPPPPPTTTPPPSTTGSAPALISYQPTGGTTYALFYMNTQRLVSSQAQELARLTDQLSPFGLSPCLVAADVNATPIKCGNGLVEFGTNELYSYGRPFNLQKVPLTLDRGVKQVFGANFLSAVRLIPGDSTGRTVHFHSKELVAQVAINIDSGQLGAPSIYAVKFVVGTGVDQVALTQVLQPGTQWAGVQVPAGFTDLAVVPLLDPNQLNITTNAQAYVTDQFSVVTKAQFIP